MTMPADDADDTPALPVPGRLRPGVPTVTLGGLEWPLPPLTPRQLRVVVPKLLKLIKHMIPVMSALETARQEGGGLNAIQQLDMLDISEDVIDDLTMVLWTALTRGSPKLTRDQFLDLPMDIMGLVTAFPLVLAATGLFSGDGKATVPDTGAPKMGEALPTLTGTG